MYKITVALFTYNQEKFIKEAIESVINQDCDFDYEIIISDDCSKDSTFDIIKNYPYPERILPHLRLIRNETNLGIISHVNNIFREAQGEWIVMCAGDDISLPNRLRVLEPHMQDGVMGVCSNYLLINEESCEIPVEKKRVYNKCVYSKDDIHKLFDLKSFMGFSGCTMAWHKSLSTCYGEWNIKEFHSEDIFFAFRALLKGVIYIVNDDLVLYRISGSSISNVIAEETTYRKEKNRIQNYNQISLLMDRVKLDLNFANIHDELIDKCVFHTKKQSGLYANFWDLGLFRKWSLIEKKGVFNYFRLLPFPFYCVFIDFLRESKKFFQK